MVRTRLEITDLSVPFAEQIPVSINYNIADIREPDKFKSSFSKTINLIGTNAINLIFENIFEVNVATQYFNKNKKTKVKYFVDDIQNFEGDLQLMQIKINTDNSIIYECSIKGEGGSLFTDIGDNYITGNADVTKDLDFSAYNHTYNRPNQIAKRSNAGLGYDCIYGHIENGSNGGSEVVFETRNFIPMFHVREYVKKIIELTGRTYTSTILDSAEFKKHVIYPNVLNIGLSQTQIDNKQFYCGLNTDYTLTSGVNYIVALPNDTAPFFDVGNQKQFGDIDFTLNSNGNYNVVCSGKFKIDTTHTNPAVAWVRANIVVTTNFYRSIDGGVTWLINSTSTQQLKTFSDLLPIGVSQYGTIELATGSQFFYAGQMFRYHVYYILTGIAYYNSSLIQVFSGTGALTVKLTSGINGTSFYALLTDKTIADGDVLNCNLCLPNKIKQKDFLKSIISAFKLQIDIDKNDSNNLIIETFDVFHAGPILNYENKTDLDKEQTNNINTLDAKTYNFSYKSDADFYNTLYQNKYNEVFGTENIVTENDFSQEVKKTELIFSGTPNVANYALGIAVPKIYKKEGSVISSIVPNIRLLTCGGIKTAKNNYTYNGLGLTPLVTNQYLYVGHTDDAFDPTYDLNFGVLKECFYTYINTYFTTNNLYNKYSRNYILNISDRDAKFISKYLWVTAKDLNTFTFRNRLFIDGAYYSVNKIENYTPLDETSTKYELIKLIHTKAYVPTRGLFSDNPLVPSGGEVSTGFFPEVTSIGAGDGSALRSTNTVGIGDGVLSPASARNILVVGDNTLVPEGAENFVQFNDIYYPNIMGANSDISLVTGVATYNVSKLDSTILIDGLGGGTAINIAFPTLEYVFETATFYTNQNLRTRDYGKKLTFKKIDANTNNIIITPTSGTIDGSASYTLRNQYDTITIQFDGTNWFII